MKKSIRMISSALALALCLGAALPALASEYTVVKGDSLWKIAKEKLGSGKNWTELYEANKDTIKDPNLIYVGQVISIPDEEPAPAAEAETVAEPVEETAAPAPVGKVVVNFEGVVTAIDGDRVTLDSGKVLLVTGDTLFGAPGREVDSEISVGCFLQGYTADDAEADEIAATRIWVNLVPEFAPGRIMINYEGRITAIDGDRVTLDSGKVLILTEDTVYSIPQGIVKNVILTEGTFIQGYTSSDPEADEIVAARLHVTPL